jgi:hypothetical protein
MWALSPDLRTPKPGIHLPFYITNMGVNPGLNPGFGVMKCGLWKVILNRALDILEK